MKGAKISPLYTRVLPQTENLGLWHVGTDDYTRVNRVDPQLCGHRKQYGVTIRIPAYPCKFCLQKSELGSLAGEIPPSSPPRC